MGVVLRHAVLVDLDPPGVQEGGLRLDGGFIASRGGVNAEPGDTVVDCGGAVVLPGLVNGHTHLYSSLATGMPPPRTAPTSFREILERVWWRLDQALDADGVETSARVGSLDAVRCGTTTLIDHHASPNFIVGSLDAVERGADEIGVRIVQCYETTDRHGPDGARQGLEENRRYLDKCARRRDGRYAAMAGAHAAFTLERQTLEELGALASVFEAGVHIHVAEDACDEQEIRRRFGMSLLDLLEQTGILRPASILVHGTHLDADAMPLLREHTPTVAHNPRSNMNNAVGYAPVAEFPCPVILGTDGIGSDMLTEARFAWFKARDSRASLSGEHVLAMLAGAARRASQALGVTLGRLEPAAAADVVVTDYVPTTPLTAENVFGHLVFGLGPQFAKDVMIGGRWVMQDRRMVTCDEKGIRRRAREQAAAIWKRMELLSE
ncbi:MAG: amidohydrolase family protein [Phycisphaerae bacterium]|nr:amidohydrolase family protein [Phycisphaerae bacterium]